MSDTQSKEPKVTSEEQRKQPTITEFDFSLPEDEFRLMMLECNMKDYGKPKFVKVTLEDRDGNQIVAKGGDVVLMMYTKKNRAFGVNHGNPVRMFEAIDSLVTKKILEDDDIIVDICIQTMLEHMEKALRKRHQKSDTKLDRVAAARGLEDLLEALFGDNHHE